MVGSYASMATKWEETRMTDTYSDANDVCMREHENLVCVTTIERHMHISYIMIVDN